MADKDKTEADPYTEGAVMKKIVRCQICNEINQLGELCFKCGTRVLPPPPPISAKEDQEDRLLGILTWTMIFCAIIGFCLVLYAIQTGR